MVATTLRDLAAFTKINSVVTSNITLSLYKQLTSCATALPTALSHQVRQ